PGSWDCCRRPRRQCPCRRRPSRPSVVVAQRMTPGLKPSTTTAVIGAGPYGLSIAAHLRGHGVPVHVFGKPMDSWRKMPARMFLKSVWSASSLAAPEGAHSLEAYRQVKGVPASEPIALDFFIDYAMWFQDRAVPEVDHALVTQLSQGGDGFRVEVSDGRVLMRIRWWW